MMDLCTDYYLSNNTLNYRLPIKTTITFNTFLIVTYKFIARWTNVYCMMDKFLRHKGQMFIA